MLEGQSVDFEAVEADFLPNLGPTTATLPRHRHSSVLLNTARISHRGTLDGEELGRDSVTPLFLFNTIAALKV